jgi:hypothetical protein
MTGGKVKCTGEHGTIGLKKALRKSCNCYFAQLTEVLGADTLQRYVEKLQITEPVSFDGITTAKGSFRSRFRIASPFAVRTVTRPATDRGRSSHVAQSIPPYFSTDRRRQWLSLSSAFSLILKQGESPWEAVIIKPVGAFSGRRKAMREEPFRVV